MSSKVRWLTGVALVAVSVAGCDSGAATPPTSAADWVPDSVDFVLSFDAACDEPCEHFEGSYEVVYRHGRPTTARRIESGRELAHVVSSAEVHFFPSPQELVERAGGAELDEESGLPITTRRNGVSFSNIAIEYDLADAAAALAEARRQWEGVGLADYRISYSRGCFCAVTGLLTFEVRDGKGELVDSANGYDPHTLRSGVPRTVEDLHDRIEQGIIAARSDYFTLEFGESGVPKHFSGDVVGTYDDEFGYGSVRVEEIP